jgi:hypothetical protein
MFLKYNRKTQKEGTVYKNIGNFSLAGYKNGLIFKALNKKYENEIKEIKNNEGFEWNISADNMIASIKNDSTCDSLIIDAKPNNEQDILLLEIENIWGRTEDVWTPILLELNEIPTKKPYAGFDKNNFMIDNGLEQKKVFTMLYLNGSFKDGKREGIWNFSGRSPTNSIFLWPETLKYFTEIMKK